MDLPSLFFSIEAMKKNSILVLPSKQRLHKLRLLQKPAVRNPAGTRLDSSSLVNKQVASALALILVSQISLGQLNIQSMSLGVVTFVPNQNFTTSQMLTLSQNANLVFDLG